jgi:signal transduction histidine kinase
VAKHARAGRVRVSARVIGSEVVLEVQDDGVGFEPLERTAGFGVAGMRERVYLAGGGLELESGASGTLVRAHLPLPGGTVSGRRRSRSGGARPALPPPAG